MPIVKKNAPKWVKGQKKRIKTHRRNEQRAERVALNSTGWYGTTGMRHAGLDIIAIRKRRAKNKMRRATRQAQRRAAS